MNVWDHHSNANVNANNSLTTLIHTHTYTHTYIYICVCGGGGICMCVCVYFAHMHTRILYILNIYRICYMHSLNTFNFSSVLKFKHILIDNPIIIVFVACLTPSLSLFLSLSLSLFCSLVVPFCFTVSVSYKQRIVTVSRALYIWTIHVTFGRRRWLEAFWNGIYCAKDFVCVVVSSFSVYIFDDFDE